MRLSKIYARIGHIYPINRIRRIYSIKVRIGHIYPIKEVAAKVGREG